MCVDNQLLFVLWESLEDFVQSGTESILSRGDARLLVLCSGSFYARTWYKKGGYTDCETTCHEEQRRIFSANGKEISNFVYDLFKHGKCVGFRVEVLGIILAVTVNIKEWFIHIPVGSVQA